MRTPHCKAPVTSSAPRAGCRRRRGHRRGHRRRCRRATAAAAAAALLLLGGGCSFPAATSGDVSQGQLLLDMADALDGLRSQNADLQAQIDSLRVEVARQDSLLARVAARDGITGP